MAPSFPSTTSGNLFSTSPMQARITAKEFWLFHSSIPTPCLRKAPIYSSSICFITTLKTSSTSLLPRGLSARFTRTARRPAACPNCHQRFLSTPTQPCYHLQNSTSCHDLEQPCFWSHCVFATRTTALCSDAFWYQGYSGTAFCRPNIVTFTSSSHLCALSTACW